MEFLVATSALSKSAQLASKSWINKRSVKRVPRYGQFEVDRRFELLRQLAYVLTTELRKTTFAESRLPNLSQNPGVRYKIFNLGSGDLISCLEGPQQAMKPGKRQYFLAMFEVLTIVCLIGICTATSLAQPKARPITLDNLLQAIEAGKSTPRRLPVRKFVALLDKNGVDFQLTEEDEKRIRVSGAYYGPGGLNSILAAVRRNFRPASAANSPLQVQYRLVAGNSIDFFLKKSSKKDWQMLDIDGKVSIVPNNTYETLSQLARSFSVPFRGQYFDSRNADRSSTEIESLKSRATELASSYRDQQRHVFVGSGGWDGFPNIYLDRPDLIKWLADPAKPWRIYLSEKPGADFGSPLLRTRDIAGINRFCFVLTGIERQPRRDREDQLVQQVTEYIRNQFSSSTKELLQDCTVFRASLPGSYSALNPELKPLLDDLNKILRGPSLYHQEAFKEAQNRSRTTLPKQLPKGDELVRLNRRFLVSIYPDFILEEHESSFVFLKQLQREDLTHLNTLGRFYDHITQSNLPSSFGYLETRIKFGRGCDVQPYESTRVVAPYLALWIAVFENVTDKPVRVGSFAFRENLSHEVRTREEDTKALNAQVLRQVPLYPVGTLRPNEKIIIPLELVLLYPEDIKQLPGFDESPKAELNNPVIRSTQLTSVEEEKPFRRTSEIILPSGRMTTGTILDILRRLPLTFTAHQKYVYGPSMKIENVEVNEARYQVRPFNPDKPLITSSGYMGASCPFIYTYDGRKRSWVNEGVVMAGFDAKSKESMDVKLLQRFDGRILLEEIDAEESFIDSLQVRAKTVDGKEILLHPKNKLLLSRDGKYIKLRQGERIVVDFDVPNKAQALEYRLEVWGYYLPYEHSERKRAQ